jgi:hypothetical protein
MLVVFSWRIGPGAIYVVAGGVAVGVAWLLLLREWAHRTSFERVAHAITWRPCHRSAETFDADRGFRVVEIEVPVAHGERWLIWLASDGTVIYTAKGSAWPLDELRRLATSAGLPVERSAEGARHIRDVHRLYPGSVSWPVRHVVSLTIIGTLVLVAVTALIV